MNNAVKNYQHAQVNTVGNGEVIILLYEGAIRFLTQAKEKIAEKDYATKGMLISRAMDIVHELDKSLNMEKGGEIAQNLHSLYLFASTTLLRANIKLDCEMIDSVIHILGELKWSFEHIVNTPEAKAAEEEIRQTKTSTYVARAVTTAPSQGVGKSAANSAYANVAKNAGVDLGAAYSLTSSNTNSVEESATPADNEAQPVSTPPKKEISAEMIGSFLSKQASSVGNANAMQAKSATTAPTNPMNTANTASTAHAQAPINQTVTQTVTQRANPFTLNSSINASTPKAKEETVQNVPNPSTAETKEKTVLKNPLLSKLGK